MPKVVVTGFGAFGSFSNNPSSEVADKLITEGISGLEGSLIVEKMPVEYEAVERIVKRMWKEHKPDLIVHIGAHPVAHCVKLEQQSFKLGYCRYDVANGVPKNNVCPCDTCVPDTLRSTIDCEKIAKIINEKLGHNNLVIEKSLDPGTYLCAYSFFLSLSKDVNRALFIHVPAFDDECTADMVTEVVRETIRQIVSVHLK